MPTAFSRRLSGTLILACAVALAAGTDPAVKAFYRIDPSGVIHTDGGSFANFSEYLHSEYFRNSGRRCLVKRPPCERSAQAWLKDASDCSVNQTVIRNEYWPDETLILPVVFHVIQKTDGTGALTDRQIADQVQVLNEDFGAVSGSLGENGYNSRINFVLAGVTRDRNDAWFDDEDEMAYKEELAWNPQRYINIYTNTASGYLGYSYYPQEAAGEVYDGVVLNYETVGGRDNGADPYDQGRTLVHELGHYFGLLHTFEEGCTNTLHSGDLIVDTNPEAVEHYGCVQTYSCGSADPIHNYMDYTDDACMNRFTRQQANRMLCCLVNYRGQLYEKLLPPKNPVLSQTVNDLILFREYINSLSWQINQDSTTPAASYRIYRKDRTEPDDSYVQLAEVDAATLSYQDRYFVGTLRYTYRITALSESGLESSPVTVSQE